MKRLLLLIALLFLFTSPVFSQQSPPSSGSGGINRASQQQKPYVILISLDGFRADYLDRYESPNLHRIIKQGVRTQGLIPVFPSKTFPNHYSIATGLYAEHHGIVANSFYDPERDQTYSLSDRKAVQDGTWYRGEPIWVTAEKQGIVAACFFFPGTEAAIQGVRPTIWKEYDGSIPNETRVDTALSWLQMPEEKRPHLLTLYMSDVDNAGHRYGPGSSQVADAIKTVDRVIGRLLDGIETLPVRQQVYVVVVSDHGMTESTPEQYISIESLIKMEGVRVADAGPNANLHISGGRKRALAIRNELNRKLQHGRAYLRSEIPPQFHYRADRRIGDLVIIMEEHYQIGPKERMPKEPGGSHGWNPILTAMHGIFLASGPGIKQGATIPRFRNVDIYPLMTKLLKLKPAKHLDGRLGRLRRQILR